MSDGVPMGAAPAIATGMEEHDRYALDFIEDESNSRRDHHRIATTIGRMLQQQLHGGQRVPQFMSYAGRQPTDRRQPLVSLSSGQMLGLIGIFDDLAQRIVVDARLASIRRERDRGQEQRVA